jgi:hypothetical protein
LRVILSSYYYRKLEHKMGNPYFNPMTPDQGQPNPAFDNQLVKQAQSALRVPIIQPSSQHFVQALEGFQNNLDNLSGAYDAMHQYLQQDHTNPFTEGPPPPTIVPDKPQQTAQAPMPRNPVVPKTTLRGVPDAPPPAPPAMPAGPDAKAALQSNPGQLLAQLLSLQNPAQHAHASFQDKVAQVLQGLGGGQPPAVPPPRPIQPIPLAIPQVQYGAQPNVGRV